MIGRDEIRDRIREAKADVELEGGLAMIGLSHFNSAGQEVPVDVVTSKSGEVFADPEKAADRFYNFARRHAAGLSGAQQFQLAFCYGNSGKPQRTQPFLMAGASAIHGAHGLSTEAPTGMGQTQQAMRLLEILAQGSFSQVGHVTGTMATLLDKLSARLEASEKRSDERAGALMNVLTVWQQQQVATQVRALMLDGARRILPLLPALASATTGLDVPTDVAEASFFDAMVEAYPPEQLKAYVSSLTPPANAVAADMLLKAQRRKQQRATDQQSALTYDEASADAAGNAWRALGGRPAPDPNPAARIVKGLEQHEQQKTNGQSNGHMKAADDGAALLDELIALMPDAHGALVGMIEAKNPSLAARLQQRVDAHKKEA
jgi:hypothetical protein